MTPRKLIQILSVGVILVCMGLLTWMHFARQQKEAAKQEAAKQRKVTVAMKWTFAPTMAPYFYANANEPGIFKKHDLIVTLSPGGQIDGSIQQVLTGRAQFGIAGANEIVRARSQDLPLVAVAALFRKSPVCLLHLKAAKISTPADLVGKKIQVNANDHADLELTSMLRIAGVPEERVTKRTFNYSYEELLSGVSDAAVAYYNDQPVLEQIKRPDVTFETLKVADNGVKGYADVLFTTEDYIHQNRTGVLAVVESFIEAWRQSFAHPSEAAQAFLHDPAIRSQDALKLWTLPMVMQAIDRSRDFVLDSQSIDDPTARIGSQDEANWEETIKLMAPLHLPKTPKPADCFTNEFVQTHILSRRK